MKLEKDSNDGVEMIMYSTLLLIVGFFLGFYFCAWANDPKDRIIKTQYEIIDRQDSLIDVQDSLINEIRKG